MPRFFLQQPGAGDKGVITLIGDDYHHITHVLRLGPGDQLIICDGARTDYLCRIETVSAQSVDLIVLSRQDNQAEPPYRAILYQGLARSDRMDILIQKSVELGVAAVVPVACNRSLLKISARDAGKKTRRWQKIAEQAAKQSGRGLIPLVGEPLDFKQAVDAMLQADIPVFPWESERQSGLRSYLEQRLAQSRPQKPEIAVLIGPEGGFSAGEVEMVTQAGIKPVSLGKRILRTETAGMAVLAMLAYQFNDF